MAPEPSNHEERTCGGPIDGAVGAVFASGGFHPPLTAEESNMANPATETEPSLVYRGRGKPGVRDWGYPGFLSEEEYRVFKQFREEVRLRDDVFRSTVFSFERAYEEESYALCRWLRARKFVLSNVIRMVEEAATNRADAAAFDFFPNPHHALGVEACIYHSQYPQFYHGYAKGGFPLFISKVGCTNTAGLECCVTTKGILNFHWYDMMHDYVQQLKQQAKLNPAFKRYETVVIMDLDHLTSSQVSKRALDIIRVQSEVDSLCFPETLHRLVIVNAPSFFTMTWRIIKNWVDERTANKVTIFGTNRSKWVKKIKELVGEENLPEDYGGKAESTDHYAEQKTVTQYKEIFMAERSGHNTNGSTFTPAGVEGENITGHRVHLFAVRSQASHSVTLTSEESMRISVFTRSLEGCTLNVLGPGKKKIFPKGVYMRHLGAGIDEENPTRVDLDTALHGPGRFKIKLESHSGPFSVDHFLFVGKVYTAKDVESPGDIVVKEGIAGATIRAPSPSNSEDDSSEDNILDDASSLCKKLCHKDGIRKDSVVLAPLLLEGSGSVPPQDENDATQPLEDPAENNSYTAEKLLLSAQPQDHHAAVKHEAIAETVTPTVTEIPTAVTVEPEQAPNTFMCGVFSGAPHFLDILSRIWCGAPPTKR